MIVWAALSRCSRISLSRGVAELGLSAGEGKATQDARGARRALCEGGREQNINGFALFSYLCNNIQVIDYDINPWRGSKWQLIL